MQINDSSKTQLQPQALFCGLPSHRIDAAICDLVMHIYRFSDEQFDAEWLRMTDLEIEYLIIRLIDFLKERLSGQLLTSLLQEIRCELTDSSKV